MHFPTVRRIISRGLPSNRSLGKRAPHGVPRVGHHPLPPDTTQPEIRLDTMKNPSNCHQQPGEDSARNSTNPPPPTYALPPRPAKPTLHAPQHDQFNDEVAQLGRQMAEYAQSYAQRYQLPGQQGFFSEHTPLSFDPNSAPPFAGSFASAQPHPVNGNQPVPNWASDWASGPGYSNSIPPPQAPFGSAPPSFFPGNVPASGSFHGAVASPTTGPSGHTAFLPPMAFSSGPPPSNVTAKATRSSQPAHEYGSTRSNRVRKRKNNKLSRAPSAFMQLHPKGQQKGKEPKLYLPAPIPSQKYLEQASRNAEVIEPPETKLVILDLNGTVLHRPNRNQPKKMIARPFLPQFLQYLFENFQVMVWSSAKPENVKALVEVGLGDYRHWLVACWARDTLGLAPHHYSRNVQCYKDLHRIWSSNKVQHQAKGYAQGTRFDQRNTILIDDSSLKAAAQPHNLLEIPEFNGDSTKVPNAPDFLAEVAGYLRNLRMQEDVSKFIHKDPFRANGTWKVDWAELGVE